MAVQAVGLLAGQTKFHRSSRTPAALAARRQTSQSCRNSGRIRSLGWKNERTCEQALRDSTAAMLVDAGAGRFGT
jgi:hypothetical protein